MRCPACGADVPDGYAFCDRCGASLDSEGPAPVVTYGGSVPSGASQSAWMPTTSLVLGIIAVVMSLVACVPYVCFCSALSPLLGIGAIVLGMMGRSAPDSSGQQRATWGIILGIAGAAIWTVMLILQIALGVGVGLIETNAFGNLF